MKTVQIEVSRKEYASIVVAVPDDFDPKNLLHSGYGEAITEACDVGDTFWDRASPWEEDYEVHDVEVVECDEDDRPIDLTAALAEADRKEAERRAAWEAAKAARG